MPSGLLIAFLRPGDNMPPAASYATEDTRNSRRVLDFDAAADEAAVFRCLMPSTYGGGGVTVTVNGMATSATSGAVRMQGAFERNTTDQDADSFATANSAGVTVNATSGIEFQATLTFTNSEIDGVAAGEEFLFKFNRDADGTTGTDDAAGDFELTSIVLKET